MFNLGKEFRRNTLTPSEAKAEIGKIRGDKELSKILFNHTHPRYKEIKDKLDNLYKMANTPQQ
jgi:hypothetical protein